MTHYSDIISTNIYWIVVASSCLQILGTAVLGIFSFVGLKISENSEAYIEGILKIEVHRDWRIAAQAGLIALMVGIALSAITTLATLPPK